jgi:hypothetical protein
LSIRSSHLPEPSSGHAPLGDVQTPHGDIVVSTAYKAGTTLTQTIVFNLLFPNGDAPAPVMDSSP